MPAISAPAKVLVSGANGFIAVWVVKDLLDQGYAVRGTVRVASKGTHLLNLFKKEEENGMFELVVVPDITASGAFDDAVKGVDAIAHTASPFHFNADEPKDLINPAVEGTVGILESAMKYAGPQLKRIAVTSSCAAMLDLAAKGAFNEHNWNENSVIEVREKGRDASQSAKYFASKVLAEKAAWNFIEINKSEISWDLTTLNPPFAFLHEVASPGALNSSVALFYETFITKRIKPAELEMIKFGWVDVRDVSRGHVLALEVPSASGERFILSGGPFILQDWYDALNKSKISGVEAPVSAPSTEKVFQRNMYFDNMKAQAVLGIVFRDNSVTARDSVQDMRKRGWLSQGQDDKVEEIGKNLTSSSVLRKA
ncbi:hypothetical protein EW145_g5769 [Phellinidium pouzarii]|uniref:NAD-dependent epimerase/dehydratase domain-containing protein n=1 Tax=Phellinidium pouzarii TaxID=167371 RepID=A0A4S4KYW6_9AGAM|nr:hypothetical protein EW145_g5769 [Phellinidium pouzarii]